MTLKDVIAQVENEFDLLWGIAPPDSLKGKKGADIKDFIRSYTKNLLQSVEKEKHEHGLDQYAMGQSEGEQYGRWKAKEELVEMAEGMKKDEPDPEYRTDDEVVYKEHLSVRAYNSALTDIINNLKQ